MAVANVALASARSRIRPGRIAGFGCSVVVTAGSLPRLAQRSGFGDRFSIAAIDQIHGTWTHTPDETLLGLGHGLAGFDFLADLAGIAVPTVVVCGDRDAVTPLGLSRKIAAAVPRAELEIVEGAGHMIVWENVDTLVDILSRLAVAATTCDSSNS